MVRDFSNTSDVIDSRDIIARIEELQDAMDEAKENEEDDHELVTMEDGKEVYLTDDFNEDDYRELKTLKDLEEEASANPDWKYGECLIHESYFVDYCQQLCEDVGAIPRDVPSYIVIDWEATAENLKQDYYEVDYDGETYLVRC
jgi:hypothetical protein